MFARGVAVWFVLLLVAIANGMVRETWIVPRTGAVVGHAISSLTLSAAILGVAWLTIEWIGTRTPSDAIRIGVLWFVLTIAFEFGAGHYLFGRPWSTLFDDYNVLRGRIWVVVLLITATAPLASGFVRQIFSARSVPS